VKEFILFLLGPRRLAELEFRRRLDDIDKIANPMEKRDRIETVLWGALAPLHSYKSEDGTKWIMYRLWLAAFIKSRLFIMGPVKKMRLQEYVRNDSFLSELLPVEGIGLIVYLLGDKADTFERVISEVKGRKRLVQAANQVWSFELEKAYPEVFVPSSR